MSAARGDTRLDDALRRLAPLTGILWAITFTAYVILAWEPAPKFGEGSPEEIVAYFTDEKSRILAGSLLASVSGVLFLWWGSCLRSALAEAEGSTGRLANAAFGSAVAAVAIGVAGPLVNAVGAIRVDQAGTIDPATATAIFDIGQVLFGAAEQAAASALVIATGLAALRYRAVLPTWLALISVPLGVALLLPAISLVALGVGVVWVSVISVLLYVQHAGEV